MKKLILSVPAAILLSSAPATASWLLIDNFEALAPGTIVEGTTGPGATWTGDSATTISAEVDPSNASNMAAQLSGGAGNEVLRAQFSGGESIIAGDTGTIFYRFRTPVAANGGSDAVVALTDNNGITNFNFKSGLRNTVPAGVNNMDVRNGTSYESTATLADNTWYSLWMVAENTNPGTFELYLQSDTDAAFATQTQLSTAGSTFDFRTNNANDIINFYIRGAANTSGVAGNDLYYDDIYLNSDSVDLSNPIPEPSSALMIGLGGLAILIRRRRS